MLSPLPRSFVTIVETGSISRAAEDLGIAKSAVSQNLKRLEERLGVKLANRTTRQFVLTPAGEKYYQHCKGLLALSQRAATEMEVFGAEPAGPLKITAPHAFIGPVIAPALLRLKQRFPRLEPFVIAEDKRLDLVSEGIDVAITAGHLPDSSLRARRIGQICDVLCVSPALMSEAPAAADPAFCQWVQSLPYLAHVREPLTVEHNIPVADSTKSSVARFTPSLRSNTIEALVSFVREGLGIALLPDIAVLKDLQAGCLVRLCPVGENEPEPIFAVHAYGALAPKSVQAVIEAISAAIRAAGLEPRQP
ncbi:LysR family transcriptional regulator [Leisingera sp. ANG-M1]|uniref:LysR family transcriptional regulator n=1 Tax=Leisingera sp. ANG-M1 TaxID=1577895 RepID=UPI00057F7DFF|nr:LysR family transcriptional regulator [Leisingera sp. ANG-M1]KIC07669.1 LysR family transcriptional regulator [Leisingera sp. ANG-M1]